MDTKIKISDDMSKMNEKQKKDNKDNKDKDYYRSEKYFAEEGIKLLSESCKEKDEKIITIMRVLDLSLILNIFFIIYFIYNAVTQFTAAWM